MVLIGEQRRPELTHLVDRLNDRGLCFFGGVFPGLIHGDRHYRQGAIIKVLPMANRPLLIRLPESQTPDIPGFDDSTRGSEGTRFTAITLVDGLTSNISLFLSELFNHLGDSVHYFGGGAGSLSLTHEPCLFTAEGVFQDAAIVALIRLESNLGVRHGWKKLTGPIVATRTRRNVISELNWRNAYEVYSEAIVHDAGRRLDSQAFFDVAKEYPFGIYRESSEFVVRDPIAVNELGELTCVGEVPENTVLSILKGEKESLIQAAGQAAEDCRVAPGRVIHHSLVADCISRVLYLEKDFEEELLTIKNRVRLEGEAMPQGVLTLGEISSDGDGTVEFFNKTIVAGTLYE